MKIGSKKWEKRGYTFGAFAVMILFLISVTYLSGNHLYSMQYSLDEGAPSYSACESCSQLYSSKQFTYGSNWGTWYVNQNALFPIQLKVNDMFNENSIDDVYSKYRVTLRDKGTGSFIKDYSGNFENAGYMESATISYDYIVPKEMTVEAEVYLSRDGGLTWEESYYYQTMTRPTWTFKFQATSIADIDKDGIPDDDDWCPTQPETVNGYLDNDGCPDILPNGTTTTTTTSGGTTTTIIVPSDSNSLPSNEPGDDATADDDGSGDNTVAPVAGNQNTWNQEGEKYYAYIVVPVDKNLAIRNYELEAVNGKIGLVFEGRGADEYIVDEYGMFNDPNQSILSTILEEGVTAETISYEWDMNNDNVVDHNTRHVMHTFDLEGQPSKSIVVTFRVKMRDADGRIFYSYPTQMSFTLYDKESLWNMGCQAWSSQFPQSLSDLGLVYCYVVKALSFSINLPIIVVANLWYTLTEVFCISHYDGFWANNIPLIVFGVFLLLMLIPDNVISFALGSALAYFLGTTAPAVGLASIPMLTALGTTAIPAGIVGTGLFSTAGVGPLAIVLMFVGLALFQVLFGEGTQSFTKAKTNGDGIVTNVNVNVSVSSGMDKARVVFADAVLILSVLMIAECKLGIPIYSALWKIIWLIPDLLVKIATALGGAL